MAQYRWAVIGAGPAGILAVGKLLDNGVDPKGIAWVDPAFGVGDIGAKWYNVSGNTKLYRLELALRSCDSFGYDNAPIKFALRGLDPGQVYLLRDAAEPFQWITDNLRKAVTSMKTTAEGITFNEGIWRVMTRRQELATENVVLALGSVQKRLDYPVQEVTLDYALNPAKVGRIVDSGDVVGVFGSSHSAIMAVHNLIDAGVAQVINFYRNPIRYAVDYGDWVLYDNTGLKGETATWAREAMDKVDVKKLVRVDAAKEDIGELLERCSKVVYGIGFEPRKIRIEGKRVEGYDPITGVMAQGLFGCGIAFPERVVDRAGNMEYNVGILKFARYLDRVVPMWMEAAQRDSSHAITSTHGP